MPKPSVKKDYQVCVSWDKDDKIFIAQCKEFTACIGYSKNASKALELAYQAIKAHLAVRKRLEKM